MNLTRLETIPAVQAVGIRLLHVHQFVYERSGGRIGHRLGGTRNLLLRTVGAKSGRPRTSALSYARDGAPYVVVASMGGAPRSPGRYHNLRARPEAEIQVGTRRMPVRATFVLPGDPDRDRLWDLVNRTNAGRYANYQSLTSRPIPVVVLTPR
ncbi:MAG TPA: nitroreductase family deazaflavin-dependent oxidoreductase [Jatrophihabitans sp.]|nr:nitroreductase family deazaflavin-dependent oxidoreductase [Jatrophihabitans sp.]